MLLELAPVWIVVLNLACIPSIHLAVSWIFTRLPRSWFRAEGCIFRERAFERRGRFYERFVAIRVWKDWLPDGAPWVGGFSKKGLMSRDPEYLREFRDENCRGEAAHYVQIPAILVTLAWNPWPVAAGVIIFYALLSNLPCILVQRHTRLRIGRLLARLANP
jgi:glycosyl-4,4'-diaponeurosporenoate acyltransferase